MGDVLNTRIDRQGRLYVPKRAGAVRAKWDRVGSVVYVTLTDSASGEYRRYIPIIPASLLAASLRGRWRRVRIRLERTREGWFGRYTLLKGRRHEEREGD